MRAKPKRDQRRRVAQSALNRVVSLEAVTFDVRDSCATVLQANFLVRWTQTRDVSRQTARLADQFIEQNRSRFRILDLDVQPRYDGTKVDLIVRSGIRIGAIPLISPTTGKNDYGLIVRPRFMWTGLGEILGATGWRIVPEPLQLPLLPRSERRIPPWVLSSLVIARLAELVRLLERKFELTYEVRLAPRGKVDWPNYARRQVARSRFLSVPCRFPDLRDDRELKAAIRFTLEKQLSSLQGQRSGGVFVFSLIDQCQRLLQCVRDVTPHEPTPLMLQNWLGGRLGNDQFRFGIQAIEWTVQERGLAGLSDLQGLAWAMSMEEFFEAWAETIVSEVGRRVGGVVRTGRQRQTVAPLSWSPPYLGSQKSLVPDLILEREDQTVIVDAKYKEHWEEMLERRWSNLDEELRARHREDLLQILAYANLATKPRTIVCLAYPCLETTWESLKQRGLLFHRAAVGAGSRRVDLLLTAFPMSTRVLDEVVDATAAQIVA